MIGEKNKEIWQSDREPGFAASDSTDSNAQRTAGAKLRTLSVLHDVTGPNRPFTTQP
jgi:hypothetical protein